MPLFQTLREPRALWLRGSLELRCRNKCVAICFDRGSIEGFDGFVFVFSNEIPIDSG